MKNALTLALALLATGALAQEPPRPAAPARVIYDAAFYAAFAPRTALDMINQTPGFVLDAPQEDERRGFSGAVGNVLVDGQRLGAKSQSLRDVLGRVAAKEVLRIEILRGAEVAGDASGATVLANVVRTPTSGGGTWEGGFEVTNEHVPAPNGRFGWSGRSEATEYSVGGTLHTHDHLSRGRGVVRDASGAVVARKRDEIPHENGEAALNGQVSWPVRAGKLTITGQAAMFRHDEQLDRRLDTPAGAQIEAEQNPFSERTPTAEAGITYLRGVGDWAMNLTALATRKRVHQDVTSTHFDAAGAEDAALAQEVRQRSGESIVRGTLERALAGGRIEIGGEVAVNTLDGDTELTEDRGAGPVPVELPNAHLAIEENRAEAFVSHVWRLAPQWTLDSRLAAETSRLSFTGDTEQSVSLTYLKPRAQLSRALGRHQLQARIFREVGQLDFTDFVSTAQLADDVINGGNPDLRPQTEWTAELQADLRFSDDAAVSVRLFQSLLDDVVDFVPIGPAGAQFDAPGNIGAGEIVGVAVSLRVPLAPVLRGGTLGVTGTWRDTEVTDPVTGAQRHISDVGRNDIKVELRQDLNAAKLAWGMNYFGFSRETDFRLDEADTYRDLHRLDVFVETTWIASFKVRLEAQSALNGTEVRDRRFHAPDRSGALVGRERTYFHPGHWWLLTVSSSF
jgi:outer membrane receptor protein involved in Fe transport